MKYSVWIGFDAREAAAFAVCRNSIARRLTVPAPVRGVVLSRLQADRLYTRALERRTIPHPTTGKPMAVQLWDTISDAPMSTEFAISRFLVPRLAGRGWAIFTDCDIMARDNLARMAASFDPRYAVMCVKHDHKPVAGVKMDGVAQTQYARKNWSSVMAFNCDHPANKRLTVEMINTLPGRDLHRFCWLEDDEIGALDPRWNYLVGHTTLDAGVEPGLVHWTEGYPLLPGYENAEYAGEFFTELKKWAT